MIELGDVVGTARVIVGESCIFGSLHRCFLKIHLIACCSRASITVVLWCVAENVRFVVFVMVMVMALETKPSPCARLL